MDGSLKWSRGRTVVVQGERHLQGLAIKTEDTGHVSKLCVKTLFVSENFHSNFVAFFVSLGIVLSCICKMLFSVTSTKQEFTPAIVSLSTSREVNRTLSISQR